MSLMPLVDLARLQTRAGHGELAYSLLCCLNDAARHRNKTDIDGRTVDLSTLTGTDEDHRAVCRELYVTLLVDGARALARIGRWTEATGAMAQHRGIGNRLLDGRQIKIMALMEQGPGPADPRPDRHHPAHGALGDRRRNLLRTHCRPVAAPLPRADLNQAQHAAASLLADPEPSIAVFQTRAGLATLEFNTNGPHASSLVPTLAKVARLDAYAACEVLGHPAARAFLDTEQASSLGSVVANAGLGTGALPADHQRSLSESVALGKAELRRLLRRQGGTRQSPEGGIATHMGDRTQHHSPPHPATEGEGLAFEFAFQISPVSTRYGDARTLVIRSPVRIAPRGALMNAVRLPVFVHPAFENATGTSGTPLHSAVDRAARCTRESRPDTRYLA
ncbi:hypothetical protein ABT269_35695 [Streptomyces viridosporus]|uniref:hypothetical protein n=1 Tax=Streptomyces viridosporus TaxID=67581 RepID=UPI00332CB397